MKTSINVRLTETQLKALDDLATSWRKETGENFDRSRVVRILIIAARDCGMSVKKAGTDAN
jgi:hypothetical protein